MLFEAIDFLCIWLVGRDLMRCVVPKIIYVWENQRREAPDVVGAQKKGNFLFHPANFVHPPPFFFTL